MKKLLSLTILVFTSTMLLGQEIKINTQDPFTTSFRQVPDKDAIQRRMDVYYQAFRKNKSSSLDSVAVLNKLLENAGGLVRAKKNIEGSLYTFILNEIDRVIPQAQESKDYRKFVKKRKMSPRLYDYVAPAIFRDYKARREKILALSPAKNYNEAFPGEETPMRTDTVRIKNTNWRGWYIDDYTALDNMDYATQRSGWEWIDAEQPEQVSAAYPEYLTYLRYPSHPEYRIVGDAVYDQQGKLIRIIRVRRNNKTFRRISDNTVLQFDMFSEDVVQMRKELYKKDFQANKHNIRSASQATQTYIKRQLDMIPRPRVSEAKSKQAAREVAGVLFAWNKKNTATNPYERRYYQQQEMKRGLKLLNRASAKTDEQGDRYLRQLLADHREDLAYIYKIERIDNTSFRLLYLNKARKTSYTGIAHFIQDGKYKH